MTPYIQQGINSIVTHSNKLINTMKHHKKFAWAQVQLKNSFIGLWDQLKFFFSRWGGAQQIFLNQCES